MKVFIPQTKISNLCSLSPPPCEVQRFLSDLFLLVTLQQLLWCLLSPLLVIRLLPALSHNGW